MKNKLLLKKIKKYLLALIVFTVCLYAMEDGEKENKLNNAPMANEVVKKINTPFYETKFQIKKKELDTKIELEKISLINLQKTQNLKNLKEKLKAGVIRSLIPAIIVGLTAYKSRSIWLHYSNTTRKIFSFLTGTGVGAIVFFPCAWAASNNHSIDINKMTIIPLIPLSDLKNNDALTEYKEDDKNYWWDFHFISKLLMPSKEDIIDDFIKKTTDKYIKSISNVSTLKTLMFPENIEPEKKQPEEAEAKKQQAEADDKKLLHEIGQTVIDDVLIAGLEKNWKEYKKTIIEKAINNIKYKNQLFWERIQFWNDREVTNPKPDISQYFILSDNCGMDILQSLPEGSCTISLEQDENQYNEKRQINNIKKVITATTDCNHSTKVNKLEPLLNGNTLQKIFPKITNVAINTPQAIQDTIEADNLNNFLVEDPEYVKKIKTNINNYITNNEKNNPCNESIECLKLILLELENIKGKTALIELVKKAEEIIAAPAQQPAPVQQPAPQP